MAGFTVESLRVGLDRIAAKMADSADELNTADGRLGDGDIGITMSRGSAAARDAGDDLPDDVGLALMRCAREFTKVSGSSYGTLLATGLMSAAKACKGKTEIAWGQYSDLFAGALEAMMARGKGKLGDKTVLDTLDAMRAATIGIDTPEELLAACDGAVSEVMATFKERASKLGRARMYGDKSIGLDDPGMLALRRMIDGLIE